MKKVIQKALRNMLCTVKQDLLVKYKIYAINLKYSTAQTGSGGGTLQGFLGKVPWHQSVFSRERERGGAKRSCEGGPGAFR